MNRQKQPHTFTSMHQDPLLAGQRTFYQGQMGLLLISEQISQMSVKPELILDKLIPNTHSLPQSGPKCQNNSHAVHRGKGWTCIHAFAKLNAELACDKSTPGCERLLLWRSRSVSAECMSQHTLPEGGKKSSRGKKKINPAALLISQRLRSPLGVHSVLVVGEL